MRISQISNEIRHVKFNKLKYSQFNFNIIFINLKNLSYTRLASQTVKKKLINIFLSFNGKTIKILSNISDRGRINQTGPVELF